MLIGTTFAWFTDSVTSGGNIIKSGNLDVEMYWAEGDEDPASATWTDASEGPIFTYDLWEPGYVEARHIKIANEGDLAFKYKLHVAPNGTVDILADVIDVYYIEGATKLTRDMLATATPIGTLRDVIAEADGAVHGALLPAGATATNSNERVGEATATIAFKMREEAGNKYQNKAIGSDFSIQLVATQYTYEEDSFNNQYDKDAVYPAVATATVTDPSAPITLTTIPEDQKFEKVSVVVPAGVGTVDDSFSLSTDNGVIEEDSANYEKTIRYEIKLLKNNVPVDAPVGVLFPVTIEVEPDQNVSKVIHNGTEIPDFQYNSSSGEVSFLTDCFSPFEVVFSLIPSDAVAGVVLADGKRFYSNDFTEVAKAMTDGAKLTLMADVDLDKTLVLDKDIAATIDLAGYTIEGQAGTLISIKDGNYTIKNGKISNEHAKATDTKYAVALSKDAKATLTDLEIAVSGTGIYLGDNAKINELNVKVSAYHTANGTCAYDCISVNDSARIDLISGGEYTSYVSESYIQEWNQTHSYSGIPSYALRINSENASVGEIRGGTFLSGDDRSNCGAVIQVNSGTLELISGGYFGFSKFGLQSPWKVLFVNTANNGALNKITGGTFEVYKNNYGCDFATIVDNSGCKINDTGVDKEVKAQFSTSIKSYNVDVYEVVAK